MPMTWIPIIPRPEADSELAAAYSEASGEKAVANILGVHSLHPEVLVRHVRLYRELMFAPSELSRAERETVAIAVSWVNECVY